MGSVLCLACGCALAWLMGQRLLLLQGGCCCLVPPVLSAAGCSALPQLMLLSCVNHCSHLPAAPSK